VNPTIFRSGGLRFFFFSREEARLHVHVAGPDGEAKIWPEPRIELAHDYELSPPDLKRALDIKGSGRMKTGKPGKVTSTAELSNVSTHGMWLLVDERELYLPFDQFPWFREVPIAQLSRVERPTPDHSRWPSRSTRSTIRSGIPW
jgi:hypothetical protein